MSVSRRAFLASLGAGGAGVFTLPLIAGRGREAFAAVQSQTAAPASRRAQRLMARRPGIIRLDSNENPDGPGPRALDAIRNGLGEANRYPALSVDRLMDAIAASHGIRTEQIILGCGSSEMLRVAVQAFTSPTRALVSPVPTFELCAGFAKVMGSPVVAPRVDATLALDLDAMLEGARGAGLVYLCNPNNPTATVHGAPDVRAFVERVNAASPDTMILIDEAYHEYVSDPAYATAVPMALANPTVIVTRTFSKVFGMAGMRAGYAIGRPETLKRMSPWLLDANLNELALVAAAATIGDTARIAAEVRRNHEARDYARRFFEGAGFRVGACEANFMMVDIRRDVRAFKDACLTQGVSVGRPFPPLDTYLRITIGTMEEMTKALDVIHGVLA